MDTTNKFEVNIRQSINTDTINEDFKTFDDAGAPLIKNTGIERDGGVTNIYEKATAYPEAGQYVITDDAKTISLVDSVTPDYKVVKIDGVPIGQCSSYGVESQISVEGVEDAFLTASSYVTCSIVSNVITLSEYSFAQVLLNTRDITFTNMANAMQFFTSLSFVRYNGIKYSDSLEFALRLGSEVILLKESTPGQSVEISLAQAAVLGANAINAICVYGSYLIVAGAAGTISSFDGTNWKKYDGTGIGLGPYGNGVAISTNDILSMAVYQGSLVVGGVGGRVGSFDGITWRAYNTAGVGLWNNAAVISTDNVTAMALFGGSIVFGGSAGKLGSWNGSAWTLYTSTTGIADNATAIGAVSINSLALYGDNLIIAGASGRIGSAKLVGGITWSFMTTGIPSGPWHDVAYGNGVWVAVAQSSTTNTSIARSTDNGVTWSFVTTPTLNRAWSSVAYGNGVWVAISQDITSNTAIARSTDNGVTWSFVTTIIPIDSGLVSVGYGNGVWIAVSNTASATQGIARSTDDGLTWAFITTPDHVGLGWTSITYGNNIWIAMLYSTSTTIGIARSTNNGLTWAFVTTPAPGGGWRECACFGSVWVAVATTTSTTTGIARSTDNGVTWSFVTTPAPGGSYGWVSVFFGNGIWVAVARTVSTTAGIARSTDNGLTWIFTTTTSPDPAGWARIAYGNGVWVALVSVNPQTTSGIARSIDNSFGKFLYNSAQFYTWISNNATVIGANNILSSAVFNGFLVVAGAGGRMGSWNGSAWTNYNAGSGLCDNATILGANGINTLAVLGTSLVLAGDTGLVGSIDTSNTKYLYSGSTGIHSNQTAAGTSNIKASVIYNGLYMLGSASSIVNTWNAGNQEFNSLWTDGSTQLQGLLDGITSFNYLYAYRYEQGNYLINLVGNSANKTFSVIFSAKTYVLLKAKYAIPQVSNNVTRHILSGNPVYDASKVESIGLHGYTDFATYTNTEVFPLAPIASITSTPKINTGYGYSDFTYTISTNIYNFMPQFVSNPGGLYKTIQGNTNTLINAYGKLTNCYQIPPSKPFEFRVCWIDGVQSYLSVALVDGSQDNLGVMITNVGEFDDTYTPMLYGDSTILYSYNGKFIITKIGTGNAEMVQRVASGIYKINSISPLNIIDTVSQVLEIGSVDYNNRMTFLNSAVPGTSAKVASIIQGKYSNSIDTGDKLVTITTPSSATFDVIGARVPVVGTNVGNYAVDTYINDLYAFSTFNDASELVDSNKTDLVYAASTIIPPAIGVQYGDQVAITNGVTIFLKPNYDGYSIGNDIPGEYQSFNLFGQSYLFDGKAIYLATIEQATGVFITKELMTTAMGLQLLASSPTLIYFLSTYDNSIFTFSGGRTLDKFKRMNKLPKINNGIFSTRDNSLLFDTDTSFIWVRDSIITENLKNTEQTALKYYSTSEGLIVSNNAKSWEYTYTALPGSSVVPFALQTSYYGFNLNELSILSNWVITIYNELKTQMVVTGKLYMVDGDISREQPFTFNVNPIDYNDGGYIRLRVQPQVQRSLGTSIKIMTDSKIVLVAILPEFVKAETATVSATRSR